MKKKAILSIVVLVTLVVLTVTATVLVWGLQNVYNYSRNADEINQIYDVQVADEGALQGATWYVAYRDDANSYQPRVTQNKDVVKCFYANVNTISTEQRDLVVERHVEKVDVADAIEYDLGGYKVYHPDLYCCNDDGFYQKLYVGDYYVVRVPIGYGGIGEGEIEDILSNEDVKQIVKAIM